jgi:polyhydroxyalkanoate synthesis regulator phasin
MKTSSNDSFSTGIDLLNRNYSSWINTWMWVTQRTLEFNKAMVSQIETMQRESRTYFEDWSNKFRQNAEFMQEWWQEGMETYNRNLETYRENTNKQIGEMVEQLDQLQTRR